jgi:exodeoxyribonuclease V alpha subunit
VPTFGASDDACIELGAAGDPTADDARVYGRELYDDECLAAERLAELLVADAPLFRPDELDQAIKRAEKANELVLETEQRHAIATALGRQVSIISGGPGVGKTTSIRILVELLEQRGVPYMRLSPSNSAPTTPSAFTIVQLQPIASRR